MENIRIFFELSIITELVVINANTVAASQLYFEMQHFFGLAPEATHPPEPADCFAVILTGNQSHINREAVEVNSPWREPGGIRYEKMKVPEGDDSNIPLVTDLLQNGQKQKNGTLIELV